MGFQTKIDIDFSQLGIPWVKNTQYRIALEEGFVTEDGGANQPNPANPNFFTFTTNATGPVITSTFPAAGTTLTNTSFIAFNYNRKISINSGQIHLYKVGSPDQLIHSFNVNDPEVTLGSDEKSVEVDLLDYMNSANSEYYYLIDQFLVKDADGFFSDAVTSTTAFRYSTPAITKLTYVSSTTRIASDNETTNQITVTANAGDIIVYFVTANGGSTVAAAPSIVTPAGFTNVISLQSNTISYPQTTVAFYQITSTSGSRQISSFTGSGFSHHTAVVYRPQGVATTVIFNTDTSEIGTATPASQTFLFGQTSDLTVGFAYGANTNGLTNTLDSTVQPSRSITTARFTNPQTKLSTFEGKDFTGSTVISKGDGGTNTLVSTMMTVS